MYVQLYLGEGDQVHSRVVSFESTPQTGNTAEVGKRTGALMAWLAHPDFEPFKQDARFRDDLSAVVTWVGRMSLDFAGYAVLNHWTLPDDLRLQREATVDAEIAKFFGPDTEVILDDTQWRAVGKIRSCMKALPTRLLPIETGLMCWYVKTWLIDIEKKAASSRQLSRADKYLDWVSINRRLCPLALQVVRIHFYADIPELERACIRQSVQEYSAAYSAADHQRFIESVIELAATEQGYGWLIALAAVWRTARSSPEGLRKCLHPGVLLRILADLANTLIVGGAPVTEDDLAALLFQHIDEDARRFAILLQQAHEETMDALVRLNLKLRDVDAAFIWTTTVKTYESDAKVARAMLVARSIEQTIDSRGALPAQSTGRGRGGRGRQPGGRGATGYAKTASSDESLSDAHRSGWSIDRYVEWIEGPIVRKARAATDAAAAAEVFNQEVQARHEELRRTLASQPSQSSQALAPEPVPSMAVGQAEAIIQEALQRAIRFIAGSLDDLIELLTRRGNQTGPDVAQYRSDLRRLRDLEASKPIDEVSARADFAEIWARVEAARASIEAEQSARPPKLSANVYRRFKESLARTLESERLELDNRTGSDVLIEADPLQFWSRIVRDFHNRRVVLPNSKHVIPPGQERNNALALYVTLGSCTKDVSFCISVHRWRRNRGSNANPSDPSTLAMDEANWTDTFDSCCVLHVKSAALVTGKK